jgi:hypothetical protein
VDKWGNTLLVECENGDEAGRTTEKWMNSQDENVRMQLLEVVKHNEM